MKSCKTFAFALVISLTATGVFGMQRHPSARRARQAAAQPRVAQPPVIGNGNRVASIHNTGLHPIYFKAIVDWQESSAIWRKTSNAMPAIIRFEHNLALILVVRPENTDTRGNLMKVLLFGPEDLPGKTILLNVCKHYGSNGAELLIQQDALCGGMPQSYARMGVNASWQTNITRDEINTQLATTEQILWQADDLIKAEEQAAAATTTAPQAAQPAEDQAPKTS